MLVESLSMPTRDEAASDTGTSTEPGGGRSGKVGAPCGPLAKGNVLPSMAAGSGLVKPRPLRMRQRRRFTTAVRRRAVGNWGYEMAGYPRRRAQQVPVSMLRFSMRAVPQGATVALSFRGDFPLGQNMRSLARSDSKGFGGQTESEIRAGLVVGLGGLVGQRRMAGRCRSPGSWFPEDSVREQAGWQNLITLGQGGLGCRRVLDACGGNYL